MDEIRLVHMHVIGEKSPLHSPYNIPKVNFMWLLMHKKVLTSENLNKRGILIPHKCCLCNKASETSYHLFVNCDFTQSSWGLMLQGLKAPVPSNIVVVYLFTGWKSRYPARLSIRPISSKIWKSIPNFLWWKIWLEINEWIFNNTPSTPALVAAKSKAFLMEAVGNQASTLDPSTLLTEHHWLGSFTPVKI